MWTKENRVRYDRDQLRYPSDTTEAEWEQLATQIPPARRGGRRRTVNIREVLNGLLYVLSTGCQWRAIPRDLPPRGTIFEYFARWQADGTLRRIHATL
jgi:transposase